MSHTRNTTEESTDQKLQRFAANPDTFTVNICEDVELYHRACNWDLPYLKKKFLQDMREQTIENQCCFVNKISFDQPNSLDGNISIDPIMNYLFDTIYFAPSYVLKKMNIDQYVSPAHSDIHEILKDMLSIREDMCKMSSDYKVPHVVLSLVDEENDYCFAKYFNGLKWCKIQLSEQLRSYVQDLKPRKYTVLGDELWLIHEDTLYCINLFKERNVYHYILPKHKFQDIQICNNGESLILLSRDMWVAEIYSVNFSSFDFKVSKWYKLTEKDYKIISANDNYALYDIRLKKRQCGFRACFVKSDRILAGVTPNNCFRYTLNRTKFEQHGSDVRIPSSPDTDSISILVDKNTIDRFLYKMFKPLHYQNPQESELACSDLSTDQQSEPSLRRHSIDNNYKRKGRDIPVKSHSNLKRPRLLTIRCQTTNSNDNNQAVNDQGQEVCENMKFEDLTI